MPRAEVRGSPLRNGSTSRKLNAVSNRKKRKCLAGAIITPYYTPRGYYVKALYHLDVIPPRGIW